MIEFQQIKHLNGIFSRVHDGVKSHICGYCGKACGQASDLKKHIKNIHKEVSEDEFNPNELLTTEYSDQPSYDSNVNIEAEFPKDENNEFPEAENNENPIVEYDEIKISKKYQYGYKLKPIKVKLRNKCDECGKFFTTDRNLKRHIKSVHEGVREHKCDTCGKYFTQPTTLKGAVNVLILLTNRVSQQGY